MEYDKKDSTASDVVNRLVRAASNAAEEVGDALQSAAQIAGEKYDVVKIKLELSTLRGEQTEYFANIGRFLFFVRTDAFNAKTAKPGQVEDDAEKEITRLLVKAEQKQHEIDVCAARLAKLTGEHFCPYCGKIAAGKAEYCSSCGAAIAGN